MADIRIQKLLADAGYCSRRRAEALIQAGKVKRNGHPVKLGDKASPKDTIKSGLLGYLVLRLSSGSW